MISVDKIERGIVRFIDNDLTPVLPQTGIKRIAVATGAAVLTKRLGDALRNLAGNEMLRSLGIVNDSGEFDVDIVRQELARNFPAEGLTVDIPMVAKMIFHQDDIEKLYRYICEA